MIFHYVWIATDTRLPHGGVRCLKELIIYELKHVSIVRFTSKAKLMRDYPNIDSDSTRNLCILCLSSSAKFCHF